MSQKTSEQLIEQESIVCAHNYSPLPVVLTKGQGVWVWDLEGKKYLDMMSAYSALSHGHSHPNIITALNEQVHTLNIVSRAFHTVTLTPFLKKLCAITGLDVALPMNTGAEAVETAIKAARRWGYQVKGIPKNQAEIIVAANNFHGRTTTIISFSSDEAYQKDFGPFTPGFKIVPFGDAEALNRAITPNTCAILIEPIQGESGIIIPPVGYLSSVEKIAKANQVLFIVDEIQSGLGRTGKWFAYQHEAVQPDGVIMGKALGGGVYPVSAFVAKKEVMDLFTPGSHGSTFGGNALASAIGLAALNTLENEKLIENSAILGEHFITQLKKISHPWIKTIRGKGLWIGLEVNTHLISARELCLKLLAVGILTKETHDTVIRFAPPLIISESELDWALSQITKVFSS
jgi:ornithine--oxo-acid transaminase